MRIILCTKMILCLIIFFPYTVPLMKGRLCITTGKATTFNLFSASIFCSFFKKNFCSFMLNNNLMCNNLINGWFRQILLIAIGLTVICTQNVALCVCKCIYVYVECLFVYTCISQCTLSLLSCHWGLALQTELLFLCEISIVITTENILAFLSDCLVFLATLFSGNIFSLHCI